MRAVVFLCQSTFYNRCNEIKISMGQILILVHKLAGFIQSSSIHTKLYLCC